MNQKAVGARIQQARLSRHMTQEQLAEKVGLTPTHISVIERGAKPPKFSTFIAIANALEVTADELLVDVLSTSSGIEATWLSKEIAELTPEHQLLVIRAIQAMVQTMRRD